MRLASTPDARVRREALADSLVLMSLLTADTKNNPTLQAQARSALLELGLAGDLPTSPLTSAVPRLLRVALESASDSVAHVALAMLRSQRDTAAAVAALERLATDDRNSASAVSSLGISYGDFKLGRDALRRLYTNGSVTDKTARAALDNLALNLGFAKNKP